MDRKTHGVNSGAGPSTKTPNEEVLSTNDLSLAVALAYSGFRYEVTFDRPSDQVRFVFKRAPEVEKVVAKYALADLRIEPRRWQHFYQKLVAEMRAVLKEVGRYDR